VEIRPLEVADAPAYRALMLRGYEDHPDAFTSSFAERGALPLSWWEDRLGARSPDSVVLGAFDGGGMVGAAGVRFETRERQRHLATLFGMYVRPESRRRGVARAIVEAAIRTAVARSGCLVLRLSLTDVNESARRLYEECGFRAWGVEPMAVRLGEGYLGHLHMWRRLDGPEEAPHAAPGGAPDGEAR
jgi:GNAT superfamily N-acetyltransferase